LDGFGREIESRAYYEGTGVASVRTDYDAGGRAAVTSNPWPTTGAYSSCPTAAVSTRDRTAFAYDTLGNAITTTFLAANLAQGLLPAKLAG
jgi:hypothetical protein